MRTSCLLLRIIILLLCFQFVLRYAYSQDVVPVGKGSYTTSAPGALPSATPHGTNDFSQKVITNTWWVNLMTQTDNSGAIMFAHPLSLKAAATGLEMGHAKTWNAGHARDILVGVDGLNVAPLAARYSDWSVTARWGTGAKMMEATIAHGLPFVYFLIRGGYATVNIGNGNVWYNQGPVVGVTVNGNPYAIFAPTGSVWNGTTTLTSSLNGKDYLSVALLPSANQETLDFFRKYAYAHVTETSVSWNYTEHNARLESHFIVQTDVKEGTEDGTVFALLRHQWLYSVSPFATYTYQSQRGEMKVVVGKEFVTAMTFNGIVPAMPDTGYDKTTLAGYIRQESSSINAARDSYSVGKSLGKAAKNVQLAHYCGETAKRDALLNALKTALQNWFVADGNPQLYYSATWNRLIGYPASYGSDKRLSDHHFHYGYFIAAAAVVAQWDREWAKPENWGGMIEMLIRDVNAWDSNDSLFGRWTTFDPYEGHGWADGMGFATGNNQESSSESMNCNAGIIMWGVNTGNRTIRDLGIFMYCNETAAIEQYWWDVDEVVFPQSYSHTCVGIVWSNGGSYSTWFSSSTACIHGINFLPITAGHLYLGRRPDYIPKNYTEGFNGGWSDLFYEFLAFADAESAWQKYSSGTSIEGGNSRSYCYQHIASLRQVGRLRTTVTADLPTYAVFDKGSGSVRTYTAYNPDPQARTAAFSDGFSMEVPARTQKTATGGIVSVSNTIIQSTRHANKLQKIVVLGNARTLSRTVTGTQPAMLYDLRGRTVYNHPGKNYNKGSRVHGVFIVKTDP